MKAYTDLEQSKKLAEILPLESADMHYNNGSCRGVDYTEPFSAELMPYQEALQLMKIHKTNFMFRVIPCWSLAALLNVLPYPQLSKDKLGSSKEGWMVSIYPDNCRYDSCWHNNQVDACYEMIIKLNEQKLL